MIQVSENTRSIRYSMIRQMFNQALAYQDVVNFTIGEPDFTASENVVEAACRAVREGHSKYSENAGILPLREAVADYLRREEIGIYDPQSEIAVTVGAMGALYQMFQTVLNPGDEVIVIEPCWTNYVQQIRMCGGVPVPVAAREEDGFEPDPSELERKLTARTKALVINSPCNPTGRILSRRTLERVAELARERELLVISDEVYKHIRFTGEPYVSIASLPGMRERTVVVDSFSKTYAMTGFRVGYAAGPEELIANLVKLQENTVACAAMPSQYAALEALEGPQTHLHHMVEEYRSRRDLVLRRVGELPGVSCLSPQGTFYAFLNIRGTGRSSEEFAERLLKEEQVVLVPGTAFGASGEGFVRISCAASPELLNEGFDRIARLLSQRGCVR